MSRALPLNAVDTCVFIEALLGKPSDLRHDCERYLARLGQTYHPALTPALVFELATIAQATPAHTEHVLDLLGQLIRNADVKPVFLRRETFERAAELLRQDPRLEPADAFHAAVALDAGIHTLVTFDSALLESGTLRKHGLLVRRPRDVLGWQQP